VKKKCLTCGDSLAGHWRAAKYCSDACQQKHQSDKGKAARLVERTCVYCEKNFRGNARQNYCGPTCQSAAQKEGQKANYRRRREEARGVRACVGCGNPLPEKANGNQVFCTPECRLAKLREGPLERPTSCLNCNGPLPLDAHFNVRFCCTECKIEGRKTGARQKYIPKTTPGNAAQLASKSTTGAPGCGCGDCQECKMFLALQHDARDWRRRERVAGDDP